MFPTRIDRLRLDALQVRARSAAAALIVAMLFLASAAAWAQYPGGGGNPGAGDRRGGMGGARGNRDAARAERSDAVAPMSVAGVVQLRLGELEEDLKLTPAQQPLWSAYHGQVMRLLNDITRAQAVTSRESSSAAQQFDRIADVARNRLTAIEDIAEAGKALYARLSPEQQALADRRLVLAVLPLAGGETARSAVRPGPPGGGEREGTGTGVHAGPGRSPQ